MSRSTAVLTAAGLAWMLVCAILFTIARERLAPEAAPVPVPTWALNAGYALERHGAHWDVETDTGADHCWIDSFEIRCAAAPARVAL